MVTADIASRRIGTMYTFLQSQIK
jgi:hypothetical protein